MAIRVFIVGSKAMAGRLPPAMGKKAQFRIAGGCASGEEAVRSLRRRRVDIVLVSFDLPCMDGSECARKLRKLLPQTPILMFTPDERANDDELIFGALHAGAQGYLPGHLPSSELGWAMFHVHRTAKPRRPVFLMLYQSDRHLSRSVKYWHKITALLNTSTVDLDYGKEWRRVIVRPDAGLVPPEPLLPPLSLDAELVAA